MRQGKKTGDQYITWNKALEFLNFTDQELYEKCSSGDLPVYNSNQQVRYHPASHFYTKKQYMEPDTLYWPFDWDTKEEKNLPEIAVSCGTHNNIKYDIQNLQKNMRRNFFDVNETVATIKEKLYTPQTIRCEFGKLTISNTGEITFIRTSSALKKIGNGCSTILPSLSWIKMWYKFWIGGIPPYLCNQLPSFKFDSLSIFFYSQVYEKQEDALTMMFSVQGGDIIQVPPLGAIEQVIKQQGMSGELPNLKKFNLEQKKNIFRLANDFAAREMCECEISPEYFDKNFTVALLPEWDEISKSNLLNQLIFRQTDIARLCPHEMLAAIEDSSNEQSIPGANKIHGIEKLNRKNKQKMTILIKIITTLSGIAATFQLKRDLDAYRNVLEYMPSKAIAAKYYSKDYKDQKGQASGMSKRLKALPNAIRNKHGATLPTPPGNLKEYQNDPEKYFNALNGDLKEILEAIKKIPRPKPPK